MFSDELLDTATDIMATMTTETVDVIVRGLLGVDADGRRQIDERTASGVPAIIGDTIVAYRSEAAKPVDTVECSVLARDIESLGDEWSSLLVRRADGTVWKVSGKAERAVGGHMVRMTLVR